MPEKQHFPDETLAYRLISEKVVKSENIKIQIWIFLSSPFFIYFSSFPENKKIWLLVEELKKRRRRDWKRTINFSLRNGCWDSVLVLQDDSVSRRQLYDGTEKGAEKKENNKNLLNWYFISKLK